MQPDPPTGALLLPKAIREGDEVWAWDDMRHRWRWARVRVIRWRPSPTARYAIRYVDIRHQSMLMPRARYWVRRRAEPGI